MSRFASRTASEGYDPRVETAMNMIVGGTLETIKKAFDDPEFQNLLAQDADPHVPLADDATMKALEERVDKAAEIVHHELKTRTTAWRRAQREQAA